MPIRAGSGWRQYRRCGPANVCLTSVPVYGREDWPSGLLASCGSPGSFSSGWPGWPRRRPLYDEAEATELEVSAAEVVVPAAEIAAPEISSAEVSATEVVAAIFAEVPAAVVVPAVVVSRVTVAVLVDEDRR
jgi:hypothetical protein